MLTEPESLSKLLSDLSIKAVSCKIDTNNGYVSEGCNCKSTSASSAAEVAANMITLRSSESQELIDMCLPRRNHPIGVMRPDGGILIRLVSCPFRASFYLCKPSSISLNGDFFGGAVCPFDPPGDHSSGAGVPYLLDANYFVAAQRLHHLAHGLLQFVKLLDHVLY